MFLRQLYTRVVLTSFNDVYAKEKVMVRPVQQSPVLSTAISNDDDRVQFDPSAGWNVNAELIAPKDKIRETLGKKG